MDDFDINPFRLRYIKEIYEKLSRGYHFCIDDNKDERSGIYSELVNNLEYYKTLFETLGYTLSDGSASIYFFESAKAGSTTTKQTRELTLFLSILYDHIADEGKDPITAILEIRFEIKDLPHLIKDQYKRLMINVGVKDSKDLHRIIKRFQKYGFLTMEDDTILFKQSVSRFTKMFAEYCEPEKGEPPSDEY